MNLVLSGGGINGIAYISLIKILEEKNILNKINKFAGTSAGAIIIFLISLKYNYTEIYDIFIFKIDYISNINYYNIFKGYIWDKILIENIFRGLLNHKLNKKYITFLEYYNLTKNELNIVATDLYTNKEQLFNIKNTPNVDVIDAVLASSSIPIFTNSVKINNKYYIDGSIVNKFPINIFKNEINKTIAVSLVSNHKKTKNIYIAYINLIKLMMINRQNVSKKKRKKFLYYIEIPSLLNSFDFTVSIKEKKEAYNLYYKIIEKHIYNINNNK